VKNIIYRVAILIQALMLFYDYYLYRYVEKVIFNNTFTALSAYLSVLLLITIIIARLIFAEDKKMILVLFSIASLEAVGNYILKSSFHVGYITHMIGLSLLFFIAFEHDKRIKVVQFIENKLSIKQLIIVVFFMYVFALIYFNVFRQGQEISLLGDPINTWVLSGWDQSAYYRMVLQIVDGTWFFGGYNDGYRYPIGYPLLSVLGYYIYSDNPFLAINITLYISTIILVYISLGRVTNKSIALIAILFLGLQSPILSIDDNFMRSMILPYNNIVTIFATSVFLYYLFVSRKIKKFEFLAIGITVGFVLLSRYGDMLFFIIPMLFLSLYKSDGSRLSAILMSFCPVVFFLLSALYLNNIFYGDFFTFYHDFTGKHEYWFHPLALKTVFWRFIEVFFLPVVSANGNIGSLLLPMVYVIFLPLGILTLIKRNYLSEVIIILIIMVSNIWYFSSTDAVFGHNIKYDALRYFGPSIIIILFLSFIGIHHIVTKSTSKSFVCELTVLSVFFFTIVFLNPIKDTLNGVSMFDFSIDYMGKSDVVSRTSYPNYGQDGFYDYNFNIAINSFFPVYLKSISVLGPHGGLFISEGIEKNNGLWGVGIINEYNKNVKLGWGDNLYKNSYLDEKKELILSIPIPNENLIGEYSFTIKTLTNEHQESFVVTRDTVNKKNKTIFMED